MTPSQRWAFIVPGDEIEVACPQLLKMLKSFQYSWKDFAHLALTETLEAMSNAGTYKLKNESAVMIETTLIEPVIVHVMEGLDIFDESSYEDSYTAIKEGIVTLFDMAFRYVPRMLEEPAHHHGEPIRIELDRVIGNDLVFAISYDEHGH
jgi:hypothetical protein